VLSPLGGAIADRLDRRRLLQGSQLLSLLASAGLAAATFLGAVQVWHIILAVLVNTSAVSFERPARDALIPALVPRSELVQAFALLNPSREVAILVGPALAGVLMAVWGPEAMYLFDVASYATIIVILFFGAVTQPGAGEGLRFLFVPDWPVLLSGRVWLEAFTQVAWSTGAGWGLLMVYAVYAREREDVAVNSGIISFADVLVGFIAASIVLGTIYAVAPSLEYAESAIGAGNVGLTFIYIVELLAAMPGSTLLAPRFFLALSLAGISSLIAMFELTTTNLMNFGLARRRAALLTGGAAFLFGIPSALSITFLDNQDWVWGVGLLISGLLTALAIMRFGVDRARAEIDGLSDLRVGAWWSVLIRLVPVIFVVVFGWWVVQSIQWHPDDWWHPFVTFSTGTMVVQWLILFGIVFALNGYLARRVAAGPMTEPSRTEPGTSTSMAQR
jgi:neurotransmitter:Na+ symporter, NSS family